MKSSDWVFEPHWLQILEGSGFFILGIPTMRKVVLFSNGFPTSRESKTISSSPIWEIPIYIDLPERKLDNNPLLGWQMLLS